MNTIAVVLLAWERDPLPLRHALTMLHAQTLFPREIVVVNTSYTTKNAHAVWATCAAFPLVREIVAPRPTFNLSWGLNVGLRRVSEQAHYVVCTGMEMLLSPGYLAAMSTLLDDNAARGVPGFGMGYCGFLPKSVTAGIRDPLAQWPTLLAQCPEVPPQKVATGAIMVAPRAWWHEVRGWDEQIPFAFSDADITRRAATAGLSFGVLPWSRAQILHQWHAPSELVRTLGGTLGEHMARKVVVVANPGGWGEV